MFEYKELKAEGWLFLSYVTNIFLTYQEDFFITPHRNKDLRLRTLLLDKKVYLHAKKDEIPPFSEEDNNIFLYGTYHFSKEVYQIRVFGKLSLVKNDVIDIPYLLEKRLASETIISDNFRAGFFYPSADEKKKAIDSLSENDLKLYCFEPFKYHRSGYLIKNN